MGLIRQLLRWVVGLGAPEPTPEQQATIDAKAEATLKGGHSAPLPAPASAPSIFTSNRSRRKQEVLLDELSQCCELRPHEHQEAVVLVRDHNWAAVVAVSVVTGIESKIDGPALNKTPHRWADIEQRCRRHLRGRVQDSHPTPVKEKHHVRQAGGRARKGYTADPSGHVTDITDSS
jgi:hypothetical protein